MRLCLRQSLQTCGSQPPVAITVIADSFIQLYNGAEVQRTITTIWTEKIIAFEGSKY